jgi:integrase
MNAIVSALRFFFTQKLDRPDLARKLVRMRHVRKLPVVLSQDEVARLLAATTCLKHQAALSVAYGAGCARQRLSRSRCAVTIGPASVITQHQATVVARRVIAYATVGHDPATDRKRIRSAPRFDDFWDEYWRRWSPHWKPSTLETQNTYRAHYLDKAFPGIFIDELNEAHVTKWFAELNNETGPGGANRVMSILNNMLNKAESWGYRLENTNPCRAVRLNRKRRYERFLSRAEMERLGKVLTQDRASEDKLKPVVASAVALLLLTGCRVVSVRPTPSADERLFNSYRIVRPDDQLRGARD